MLQKITSRIRRAIDDYNMIEDGDKIAVGLSGGKDSIALMACMINLQRFYPKKFELIGITIDMGFKDFDITPITDFCKKNSITHIVHKTDIAEIIFDIRKEPNPCSLCANLRRGAVNDIAKQNGCNKVALGHHLDDVIETFFLSLFFESRLNTFMPITYLDRTDLYVIRPLIYTTEAEVKGLINKENLPVVHNPCPADCHTKRQEIKDLTKKFSELNPNFKTNVFNAIKRDMKSWKEKNK